MSDTDDTDERSDRGPAAAREQRAPRGVRRAAMVAGLLALAGASAMAGAGLTPGELVERWRGDPGPDLDRVTSPVADEGGEATIELSVAPATRGGGVCWSAGTAWAGGAGETPWTCEEPLRWSDAAAAPPRREGLFGFVREVPIGTAADGYVAVALVGVVHSSVNALTVQFADGNQYAFDPQDDSGWFAAVLPAAVVDWSPDDGHLLNPAMVVELYDDEGARLAEVGVLDGA